MGVTFYGMELDNFRALFSEGSILKQILQMRLESYGMPIEVFLILGYILLSITPEF